MLFQKSKEGHHLDYDYDKLIEYQAEEEGIVVVGNCVYPKVKDSLGHQVHNKEYGPGPPGPKAHKEEDQAFNKECKYNPHGHIYPCPYRILSLNEGAVVKVQCIYIP